MAHISGVDRTQAVLLPDMLDDYVAFDNGDLLRLHLYGYL